MRKELVFQGNARKLTETAASFRTVAEAIGTLNDVIDGMPHPFAGWKHRRKCNGKNQG